jgi:hypothetical protein
MLGRQGKDGAANEPQVWGGLGTRLAVGGVVAFGALASGFLLSRRGRRLVVDTFRGARRTQLADQVLDRFWTDPMLGRRRLDVMEPEEGVLVLVGSVASDRERHRAAKVASSVPGVIEVRDRLVLDPSLVRRRARPARGLTGDR